MLQRDRVLKALETLRKAAPAAETSLSPPAPTVPIEAQLNVPLVEILGGEWRETEQGLAFVKDTFFALDHLHGTLPIGAPLGAVGDTFRRAVGHADPPSVTRLGFFDTETTGLSGGSGTYIFLAGLGTFEGQRFRLRQYFLPRLDGERAMLRLLFRDIASLHALVSYNGRAYDLPLLQARRTMARMRDAESETPWEIPHFDLLRAARRLYRGRLESCSLVDVESHVLGVRREDDVPGHAIPALYFDYLRAGRASPLRSVFRHNSLDILSLAGLLASLVRLFDQAGSSALEIEPNDAVALARWYELDGDHRGAELLYRSALPRMGPNSNPQRWARASSRYAHLLKRSGARDEALAVWRSLWEQGDREAGLELAKHLEHATHDPEGALEVARAVLRHWPPGDLAGLRAVEHRIQRLTRRVATTQTHPRAVETRENCGRIVEEGAAATGGARPQE